MGKLVKTISINRAWRRVYDLGPSRNPKWPIKMLCDGRLQNDRRLFVLSSIIKIYNNTTMTLAILNIDSTDSKKYRKIAKMHVNDEYYVPIDMLYKHSKSPIFVALDE